MAFRFFRRKKLFPGVSVNLSKSGASLSFGSRGARVTVGPKGVRKTAGIPGTGMYWTKQEGDSRDRSRPRRKSQPPPEPTPRPEDRLSLGFFGRLLTSEGEERFVDGMREFVCGNEQAAYRELSQTDGLADAAFMAGLLALKQQKFADAEKHLKAARAKASRLGRYFEKYGVQAAATLEVTDEVAAAIGPDRRSVLLSLAEAHQNRGRFKEAVHVLKQLYRHNPDDVVVRLSIAELLVEEFPSKGNCKTIVHMADDVDNASEIHGALLLYKAKALRKLGLPSAARDVLTKTLRRKKNRSDELLRALRYERALAYDDLGWKKRRRKALEKLYADAPDYEDVAARLGLD